MQKKRKYRDSSWRWLLLAMVFGWLPAPAAPVSAAPLAQIAATNTLTLKVISARTEPRFNGGAGVLKGAPITTYKSLINIDNTGTTAQRFPAPGSGCSPADVGYPNSCHWASIGSDVDQSPIYSHGDQTTLESLRNKLSDGLLQSMVGGAQSAAFADFRCSTEI